MFIVHLVSYVDYVIILSTAAEPLVKSLRLHGNAVMCLAADDKYIISGSKDCTVAVYDRRADKGLNKVRVDEKTNRHTLEICVYVQICSYNQTNSNQPCTFSWALTYCP